jgi:hypothetical protein
VVDVRLLKRWVVAVAVLMCYAASLWAPVQIIRMLLVDVSANLLLPYELQETN